MAFFKQIEEYFRKKLAPKPGINLEAIKFVERPRVLKRGGKYLLRYQVARDNQFGLTRVLFKRKTPDKAYYFFSIPVSHPEPGTLVERDLEADDFRSYAERDAVYWLNRDGTEIHLPVMHE